MDVFGIGPMELILILIIAMMVFGPDKLPEIGSKLGQSMKAMRRATREFSKEIEDARQVIEAPVQEITQPVQELRAQFVPLAQAVTNPQEALRQAVAPSVAPPAANGANTDASAASAGEDRDQEPVEGDSSVPAATPEVPAEVAGEVDARVSSAPAWDTPPAVPVVSESQSDDGVQDLTMPETHHQHIIFPEE